MPPLVYAGASSLHSLVFLGCLDTVNAKAIGAGVRIGHVEVEDYKASMGFEDGYPKGPLYDSMIAANEFPM